MKKTLILFSTLIAFAGGNVTMFIMLDKMNANPYYCYKNTMSQDEYREVISTQVRLEKALKETQQYKKELRQLKIEKIESQERQIGFFDILLGLFITGTTIITILLSIGFINKP